MAEPEYWLRGPVAGVPPLLQPAAHSLLQAREDVSEAVAGLSVDQLWKRPGNAAATGFHLKHLAGSLDRLLTYARGEQLSAEQMTRLKSESETGSPPPDVATLLQTVNAAIDAALEQIRHTPEATLLEERRVGRKGLASTVLGLLFHAAEHTTRHTGQIITTARAISNG